MNIPIYTHTYIAIIGHTHVQHANEHTNRNNGELIVVCKIAITTTKKQKQQQQRCASVTKVDN